MGLIPPGGENLLDFTQLRQVLSSYDGSSGTPLVASGKASPHASYQGASRDSSPIDASAEDLVWSRGQTLRMPLQC